VAAPPYVAGASRGLVLRATTDGGRLVVTVVAFRVERDDGADDGGPDGGSADDGGEYDGARYVRADDRVEVRIR
jgi:GTPase involved in cell partitioning and DNA repair